MSGILDRDVDYGGTFPYCTFGAHGAEVEVDIEKGTIKLTK